jgi:hydroxypyruvate isomerase
MNCEGRRGMFELSACVEVLFTENGRLLPARVRAAAAAGVPAVELWSCEGRDLAELRSAVDETGIAATSLAADPWGCLVDAAARSDFLAGIETACRAARVLGAPAVVVVSGEELAATSRDEQHASIVAGLSAAAPVAADHGVSLLLEPLNTKVDHPGQFLSDTAEGFRIVREVDRDNVRLLYDLYHSVAMGEDPRTELAGNEPLVGHVQVADWPGRGEPGSGSIDWAAQLTTLREYGYAGRLGLEYVPQVDTVASLAHLRAVLSGHRPVDRA